MNAYSRKAIGRALTRPYDAAAEIEAVRAELAKVSVDPEDW